MIFLPVFFTTIHTCHGHDMHCEPMPVLYQHHAMTLIDDARDHVRGTDSIG